MAWVSKPSRNSTAAQIKSSRIWNPPTGWPSMNSATSTIGPPGRASEVAICFRPGNCRSRDETRAVSLESIVSGAVRLHVPGAGDDAHAHPRRGAHDLTGQPLGAGPGRKALVVLGG